MERSRRPAPRWSVGSAVGASRRTARYALRTSAPPRRRGVPAALVGILAAQLLLAACAAEREPDEPTWVHDQQADLYYLPEDASTELDELDDDLPALADASTGTWIDGRFTDPHAREWIPAQDDYWIQAVVELEPAQAEELVARAGENPTAVEAEEVRAAIVAPVEEAMTDCDEDWVAIDPLTPLDTDEEESTTTNLTPTGMMVSTAVACPGTGQVIVELRQM